MLKHSYKESLNSIIRQTDKEWTCLLINDGSTDGSQSIIDEYCIADGRFIGLSKQNEGGCAKAKYYGVKRAKTEFIMIVDADDILGDEDYIEKLKRRQCETNADSVLSRTCCFENEKTNDLWTLPDDQVDCNQIIDGETACLLTMPNWHIGLNGRLERKELYDSLSEGDWAYIDEATRIWQYCVVLPGAKIGEDCNICSHCFIENEVVIGNRVTVKSGVQLWDGVTLEDDVFVGANVTFTNDKYPRSKHPFELLPIIVKRGATYRCG